jgi:FixJ family two-component response regulator
MYFGTPDFILELECDRPQTSGYSSLHLRPQSPSRLGPLFSRAGTWHLAQDDPRRSSDRFIKTGHLTVKFDYWRYRDDIGLSLKDGLISLGARCWTNRADFALLSVHRSAPLPGFVYVVDDDAAFRTAIERRLKKAGYEVATYPSAQHLLDRLPNETELGCILLDVRIPGLSGPELQERLRELGSTLPIIFLTGHRDIPMTVRTIKAGAVDFLTKPVSSDRLLEAVARAIARHEVSRDRKVTLDIIHFRIATLTPRERQVFELVIRGKHNKQIANALGCTERTIKAHRHGVMEKMQVRSLPELVSLAERVDVLRGT